MSIASALGLPQTPAFFTKIDTDVPSPTKVTTTVDTGSGPWAKSMLPRDHQDLLSSPNLGFSVSTETSRNAERTPITTAATVKVGGDEITLRGKGELTVNGSTTDLASAAAALSGQGATTLPGGASIYLDPGIRSNNESAQKPATVTISGANGDNGHFSIQLTPAPTTQQSVDVHLKAANALMTGAAVDAGARTAIAGY